jgi:hypothetical protein
MGGEEEGELIGDCLIVGIQLVCMCWFGTKEGLRFCVDVTPSIVGMNQG